MRDECRFRRRRTWALVAVIALAASSVAAAQSAAERPAEAQGATITGTVRGGRGRPIAAAEILMDGELRARSDSLGRFMVTGLPAGEVELLVRRFGYAPAEVRLRLAADARRNLRVELERLTQQLAPVVVTSERLGVFGQVRDTAHAPIAGAEVQVLGSERTLRTDGEGTFRLPGLEPGPYVVAVRHAGHHAARFSLDVPARGGQEVAVELAPLRPGLSDGAAREESGFGMRERSLNRSLEQRLRLREGSQAVVLTRPELAKQESLTLADYLVGRGLLGMARNAPRPEYHLQSPNGAIGVVSETAAEAAGRLPYCLFLDGELDVNAMPLRSIIVEEVETVEVVRDDLTRTLSGQLEGRSLRVGCSGPSSVVWFRR